MKNKLPIALYLMLVIIAYTAWIWLDWRIIAGAAIAHFHAVHTAFYNYWISSVVAGCS